LIGLFFMFDFSYSQNNNERDTISLIQKRIIDSLNSSDILELTTNWGDEYIPKRIKQVYTFNNKLKAISNFEEGRLVYYYEISKSKGLFNRFWEIETYYTYDSLFQLVSIKTETDNFIEFDSIHNNKIGKIDFKVYSRLSKKKRLSKLNDYKIKHYGTNFSDSVYQLIDSAYKDTILLKNKNQIVNSDSISFKTKGDSLFYFIFGKQRNNNVTIKKKEYLFVKEMIQVEKSFYKGMYKIDSTQINYFYDNDKLSVIKTHEFGDDRFKMNIYGHRDYLEQELFVIHNYLKPKVYVYNHEYYLKVRYQKEDLKSLF